MASHAVHLAARFFSSLRKGGPTADDEGWAERQLLPGERALWATMSDADRRHAVAVARRVAAQLGPEATRPVLAAALLHDVGKAASALGTFGRVAATLVIAAAGRPRASGWTGGPARRVGLYARHAEVGADMLERAGSDPLTCAWAREHHRPEDAWSVPPKLGRALRDADEG